MLKDVTVLVVEDSRRRARLLALGLGELRATVYRAGSVAEGLAVFEEVGPHVVASAPSFVDGTGCDLVRAARGLRSRRAATFAAVAMTDGAPGPEVFAAGFLAVCQRPCLPNDLGSVIVAAIARSRLAV